MASVLPHTAASAGSVVKKILAINPDLTTQEIISLVRQAIRKQAPSNDAFEFAQAEIIDEELALELARQTIREKTKYPPV